MLESASAATLAVLLTRIGTELDGLAHLVGEMQTGLSPLLSGAASNDPAAYRHAQDIDLVWQTLESLSRVLAATAREDASQQTVDLQAIAAHLPLADLSARLRGLPYGEKSGSDDLDLF